MSVALMQDWRTAGCGERCVPRQHDPAAHERYGYVLALVRPTTALVRTGPLVIDLAQRTITVDGVTQRMQHRDGGRADQPRAWRMLEALARRVGRTVYLETLLAEVLDEHGDLPVYGTRNLIVIRYRLREILGSAAYLVTTVPGEGMRLELEPPR